jgi:uncharacterized protein YcnI
MCRKQKNPAAGETGRLLLEAIVTLCLFGLFSVFIFNKQFQQQRQLEDINTAESIKVIQKAMKRYVETNWEALLKGGAINGETVPAIPEAGDVHTVDISDTELANYLPQGFAADNAFNAGFKIAIRRKPHANGKQPVQVVVVSPNASKQGGKFDNMAGARIAAMVGSGGGYIRSDAADGTATGTMGLWSLDVRDYFADAAVQEPVRVVSTTDFALDEVENPLWKSVLFRDKVDGFPNGNAMLTDIDMSGNGLINLSALKYRDEDGTAKDGFLIDAANGEIRLTAQTAGKSVTEGESEGAQAVVGEIPADYYSLKPGGTSVMKDIRLEALGGNTISEVMPKISLQTIYRNQASGAFIPAPGFDADGNLTGTTCAIGYAPAIEVTPKTKKAVASALPWSDAAPSISCTAPAISCTTTGGNVTVTGTLSTTGTGSSGTCGYYKVGPTISFPMWMNAHILQYHRADGINYCVGPTAFPTSPYYVYVPPPLTATVVYSSTNCPWGSTNPGTTYNVTIQLAHQYTLAELGVPTDYWGIPCQLYNYTVTYTKVGAGLSNEPFTATSNISGLTTTCTQSPPVCSGTGTGVAATPVAYGAYTSGWTLALTGANPAADVNVYCKLVQ